MSSINSLLDSTLDDLADMPEFKPYPAGAHKVIFDYVSKEVNNKPIVEFKFKAIETLELSDPAKDQPLVKGAETSIALFLRNNNGTRNEISEGQLKNTIKSLSQVFSGSSNREILDAAKGAEVMIVTKVRENKNSPGTFNTSLVKLEVI